MSGEATSNQLWAVTRPTRQEHRDHMGHYDHQCLHCLFYHPLEGNRGADWGVCFNVESPYGGMVKFEHQGCTHWVEEHEEEIDYGHV